MNGVVWKKRFECPFFLLNFGVLCKGGCTRGLDSWTWSNTCQYFTLSDDVVSRTELWDSILAYLKRLWASRRFRKSFKSCKLLIIFSLSSEHEFLLPQTYLLQDNFLLNISALSGTFRTLPLFVILNQIMYLMLYVGTAR
jgi:hypothetical protein